MAGDLYIRVCQTRAQKSNRRLQVRTDILSDDERGRPTRESIQVRFRGRWYDGNFWQERCERLEPEAHRLVAAVDRFKKHQYKGPSVWLGRLSRMSVVCGGALDDGVPQALQRVGALFGRHTLVVINDSLVLGVIAAFTDAPGHPVYSQADVSEVVAFLKAHRGKRAYLD